LWASEDNCAEKISRLLYGIVGESFSESWDKICNTLKLERGAVMASGGKTVSSLELFSRALIQNENNLNNRAVIGKEHVPSDNHLSNER
jgi:hypothetical protein